MRSRVVPWSAMFLASLSGLGMGCGATAKADAGASPVGDADAEQQDAAPSDVALLDGFVSCATDPTVDTYTAGLTKAGANGMAQVQITSADPAPPARGGNTWTIQVLDPAGAPLPSSVTIDLKMPKHGHGTTPTKITAGDAGSFTLDPLNLFMPGIWRVQLFVSGKDAIDAGPPLDTVTFLFCIEG
jgi:hypothetical protein